MADEDTSGQFEDGSEEQAENRKENRFGAPGGPEITEVPESGQFVAGNGESGIYGGDLGSGSSIAEEAGSELSTGGYGGSQASGGSQATPYDSGFQVGAGGIGGFDAGREAERTDSGETGDRQRQDEEDTEDEFERGND